jgi:hypothetical protein
LDCKAKVIQFNPQESAHLSQVFNRPPRRRRAEFAVRRVDVRALLHQCSNDIAMSAKGRMVKRGSAQLVFLVDKLRLPLRNGSNIRYVTTFCGLDEFLEVTHGTPPHSWVCNPSPLSGEKEYRTIQQQACHRSVLAPGPLSDCATGWAGWIP